MKFLLVSFAIASITTARLDVVEVERMTRSLVDGLRHRKRRFGDGRSLCEGRARQQPCAGRDGGDRESGATKRLGTLLARLALMRSARRSSSGASAEIRTLTVVDHDVELLGIDELEQDLRALLGAVDLDAVELLDDVAVLEPDRSKRLPGLMAFTCTPTIWPFSYFGRMRAWENSLPDCGCFRLALAEWDRWEGRLRESSSRWSAQHRAGPHGAAR